MSVILSCMLNCKFLTVKNAVYWEVTPCSLVERYIPFGGTSFLHLLILERHATFPGICQKPQHEFRFLNSTVY
jgi:hypothetical protein